MTFQGIQKIIFDILFTNIVLKLISLSAAVGIWGWVQNTKTVEMTTRANLYYTFPSNLAKVKEPRQNIAITLVGPQGIMKTIDEYDIYASIDLTESKAGENIIDIASADLLNIPKGVKVSRVSPPSVEVSLDKPMSKEVKIKPNLVGKMPEGWKIVELSTTPESITISGAQLIINSIEEVVTKAIDIKNLRENRIVYVEPTSPHNTLTIDKSRTIQVSIEVEPELSTQIFNDIPIVLRRKGWLVKPTSVSVELRGPRNDLAKIKPEEMTILLSIPRSIQNNKKIELGYKPENKTFKIVHGGASTIDAIKITPAKIVLRKTEANNFFEKWK